MSTSLFHSAPQAVVDEAAYWVSTLDAGDADEAEVAAFEKWYASDPIHQRTFERIRAIDQRIDQAGELERSALDQILDQKKFSLRRTGGILSAIVLAVSIGWAGSRTDFVRDHFPDYETKRGEQREVALEDGSRLMIDTDGAVRVRMDGDRRLVRLLRGQVFAKVAHDPARPFVIQTEEGTATALGTAFMVRRSPAGTIVTVSQSEVRVCPDGSDSSAGNQAGCRDLAPGQRAKILDQRVFALEPVDPESATLWTSGWLEADETDVSDVLTELNRYRADPILFDTDTLRGIKITGSIPLKDSARALAGILQTKELAVRSKGHQIEVVRVR